MFFWYVQVYKIRRAQLVEITCVDKFTYPQVDQKLNKLIYERMS